MYGDLRVPAGLLLVAIALPAAAQIAPAQLPVSPPPPLAAAPSPYFSSALDS